MNLNNNIKISTQSANLTNLGGNIEKSFIFILENAKSICLVNNFCLISRALGSLRSQ